MTAELTESLTEICKVTEAIEAAVTVNLSKKKRIPNGSQLIDVAFQLIAYGCFGCSFAFLLLLPLPQ